MRRVVLLVALALACCFGVISWAVELNSAKQMKYVPADSTYFVLDSLVVGSRGDQYTHWYLFQAQADEDVYIRRKFDIYPAGHDTQSAAWLDSAQWEVGPGIFVPSGKSLVVNIPYSLNSAGNAWIQHIQVSTLTDTLGALPWTR